MRATWMRTWVLMLMGVMVIGAAQAQRALPGAPAVPPAPSPPPGVALS